MIFSQEFQLKHFGFNECRKEVFLRLQWTEDIRVFLAYRTITFLYCLVWLIWGMTQKIVMDFIFLTTWVEILVCVYLLLSFYKSLRHFLSRRQENGTSKTVSGNQDSRAPLNDEQLASEDKNSEHSQYEGKLGWVYAVIWLLMQLSVGASIFVCMMFWALAFRNYEKGARYSPFNVHRHAVLTFMMILDLLMTSIPVRVLHCVYLMSFFTIYALFYAALHLTGVTSVIYPPFDLSKNPGLSVGMSAIVTFVISPTLHAILYAIYRLRLRLLLHFKRKVHRSSVDFSTDVM